MVINILGKCKIKKAYNSALDILKKIVKSKFHNDNQLENNIDLLFPSIGFFGDAKNNRLNININNEVNSLLFRVNEPSSILNIGGIEIFKGDTSTFQVNKDFTMTFSSSIPINANSSRVFNDKGFHSDVEDAPWIKVNFKETSYVKSIQIRNRSDKWGIRAKRLEVIQELGNKTTKVYCSATKFKPDLINATKELGWSVPNSDPETIRYNFLVHLNKKVTLSELNKKNYLLNVLQQSLSHWSENQLTTKCKDLEIKILATVLTYQIESSISLNLKPFINLLKDASSLNMLEEHVNKLRVVSNKDKIMFTKHGVAKKGTLISDISNVMTVLSNVIDILTDLDLQPCLAYGTLLGAYRDKGFISHDDDVDILFKLPKDNISEAEARELRNRVIEMLPKDDYKIDYGELHNLNIHFIHKKTNIMIDIFPYWVNQNKAYLHMEKMNIRGIDKNILASRTSIALYGQELPAPIRIKEFLVERYGNDWNISDKYHEWPWNLD